MGKRKSRSKKSVSSLPKGLPVRGGGGGSKGGSNNHSNSGNKNNNNNNPFEAALQQRSGKRPKFSVHNNNNNNNTKNNSAAATAATNKATPLSALAQALQQRQSAIAAALKQQKKANVFADKRIGEPQPHPNNNNNNTNIIMSHDERNLARLVRERARQSKRLRSHEKFALSHDGDNDDNDDHEARLTHKGKAIVAAAANNKNSREDDPYVMLSDDEDDVGGDLDAYDTELLHFGGGQEAANSIYGSKQGTTTSGNNAMMTAYSQKKSDLDALIARRKMLKVERLQSKEAQVDTFQAMDQSFAELAQLLHFRDKEKEIRDRILQAKRAGASTTTTTTTKALLSPEDQEHDDWEKEMKQYLHAERRVAATDRTKTVEEMAKEEADALHKLETRRLARMNGDFDNDDDHDDDDDSSEEEEESGNEEEGGGGRGSKKKKKYRAVRSKRRGGADHPEALDNDSSDDDDNGGDDHDDDDDQKWTTRFTADGLVYVDKKNGLVVGKVGSGGDCALDMAKQQNSLHHKKYKVGDKVTASYRATEQYGGSESWFNGVITAVVDDVVRNNHKGNNKTKEEGGNSGGTATTTCTYDIEYEDGDFEEGVHPRHIRPVEKTLEELQAETSQKDQEVALKRKRQKAKEKARAEIPYVFEVPTTLDALHDMIGNYATTGKDVSLIIQRIHKANSVRLDRRKNAEKMQNFYDVLLRRFVAVGDAICKSGDGGDELGRYGQLDSLTQTLYAMAQDSAEIAGAVWSRRLGFFQSAHAKRLRDAALGRDDDGGDDDEEEFTAWPSTGVVLVLRALGHIFPVTDKRHHVVSPAILFLGQMIGHTPILSVNDLVVGIMCCGLLIEYTREAKRIAPEAHAFLACVIRLFAHDSSRRHGSYPLPTFNAASTLEAFSKLRSDVSTCDLSELAPQLSLEAEKIGGREMPAAILYAALHLVESSVKNLSGSLLSAEKEVFTVITDSILALKPKSKPDSLPSLIQAKVASVASTLSSCCQLERARAPLQRRAGLSVREAAVKSLAPRLENPDRYSITQKDKGKNATQAAADRSRREYKREHKAVARELRLDGAVIENERRREQDKKDSAAKAKRQKAFAWLEGEQAVMNQQVRQGGGLLQGGGMGAAKAKAASGKFGIKKGGKLR